MTLYRKIKRANLDSNRKYLIGVAFNFEYYYTVTVVDQETMKTKFEYCERIEIVPSIGIRLINVLDNIIPNSIVCIDSRDECMGKDLVDYLIDQGYHSYLFYRYKQDSNIIKGIIRRIKREPRDKIYGINDSSHFVRIYFNEVCNATDYVENVDCIEAYLMTVEAQNILIWR